MRPQTSAFALVLGGGLLAAWLAACDSADNPLAPSGTVLTITAVPSQISLSGSGSRITVVGIRPDGNPIYRGTQITLSTDLGVLRPAGATCTDAAVTGVVEADDQGRAEAVLCGDGRTGPATVSATLTSVGGGEGGGGVTVTVQIGETDTSRPTLIVSANPSVVPVGGESVITLIGRSADNTPVAAGSRIRLTADLGTLRCASRFQCPGESTNPCNAACTDAQGEAEAIFTAGDRGGTARVAAILGTSEQVSVDITVSSALEELTLSANPNTIRRLDAGEVVTLRAIALDPLGLPLNNVLVRFQSNPGGAPIGMLSADSQATNAQGIAQVTLTVTRTDLSEIPENGSFVVQASARSEGVSRVAEVTIRVQD